MDVLGHVVVIVVGVVDEVPFVGCGCVGVFEGGGVGSVFVVVDEYGAWFLFGHGGARLFVGCGYCGGVVMVVVVGNSRQINGSFVVDNCVLMDLEHRC